MIMITKTTIIILTAEILKTFSMSFSSFLEIRYFLLSVENVISSHFSEYKNTPRYVIIRMPNINRQVSKA